MAELQSILNQAHSLKLLLWEYRPDTGELLFLGPGLGQKYGTEQCSNSTYKSLIFKSLVH